MVEQAGQAVRARPDLDGLEDLGVLEGDRDLGGEQLDELELVERERVALAQSLDREHADGAAAIAQRHDDEAAVVWIPVDTMVDSRVGGLVADINRLVVLDDPGRHAGLARLPWLQGEIPIDAVTGQRAEQSGRRIDDLDRDVVAGDQAAQPLGDALEDGPRVERGEDRLGDLEELALTAQLALQGQALVAEALGGIGVGHRLGGEAGVDHEEAQVVVAELVEPELRQDEDAQDLVVEEHRREEHRLVEVVVRPRDGVRPRVGGRVAQVLGDPVDRDPAGDPLAERHAQLIRGLVDVLADLALHGHRNQLLPDEPVDPDVVIVDQLAQLGGDGHADLGHPGEPIEANAQLLDRLELGRPGRHPVVVLGRADRDARLGRQLRHRLQLGVGPRVRPIVVDVEQPKEGRAVAKRRRAQRVEALLDDGRPYCRRRAGRRDSRPRRAVGWPRWRRPAASRVGSRGRCRGSRATDRG